MYMCISITTTGATTTGATTTGVTPLQSWFGEFMFQASFNFYKGYNIPVLKTVQDYLNNIDDMPLNDTPEIFGMHPNADIT